MKAFKCVLLIFSMLFFVAAGSSGSPGEKMSFKPGIALSGGQMDVQVVAPQAMNMDLVYTYQCYTAQTPLVMTNSQMGSEGRINRFDNLFKEADLAFDRAFKDYLLKTMQRHVDTTKRVDNAFAYGSATNNKLYKLNDGYRCLTRIVLTRFERRHSYTI